MNDDPCRTVSVDGVPVTVRGNALPDHLLAAVVRAVWDEHGQPPGSTVEVTVTDPDAATAAVPLYSCGCGDTLTKTPGGLLLCCLDALDELHGQP